MSNIHTAAPDHLPFYLPGADGSDPILTVVIVVLTIVLVTVGVMYFKIHSLPEHIAEKQNSIQLQLISVLVLLALFTHNNAFWFLALLIAVVKVPDFLTPIERIANSLGVLAAAKGGQESSPDPDESHSPDQTTSEKTSPKSQATEEEK